MASSGYHLISSVRNRNDEFRIDPRLGRILANRFRACEAQQEHRTIDSHDAFEAASRLELSNLRRHRDNNKKLMTN